MAGLKKHARARMSVSASELAQMGVCERLVVFEHRYGRRRTVEQQRAVARGRLAHERFYRARRTSSARYSGWRAAALVYAAQGVGVMLARHCQYWVRRLRQVWHCSIRRMALWRQSAESHNEP